ncbi:hypothetical protein E5D57_010564 [Metarhizium anisopliae]|nr:hypothetical protein E5D57_010564 [Metarhizium anisopliae]
MKPTQAMTICASSDKRCGLRVAHHCAKDPSEVERGDKVGARQGAPPSILKHGRWGRNASDPPDDVLEKIGSPRALGGSKDKCRGSNLKA